MEKLSLGEETEAIGAGEENVSVLLNVHLAQRQNEEPRPGRERQFSNREVENESEDSVIRSQNGIKEIEF
jgi:hypothetical protein